MAFTTFKTVDDLVDWVKQNLKTLDSGEVAISESVSLSEALDKRNRDYEGATNDKRILKRQKEEFTAKIKELEDKLENTSNELDGLKDVHSGNDKEILQKLNKEKSDLVTKVNALESQSRELQKQVEGIPALQTQLEGYRAENSRAKIMSEVRRVGAARKVPQYILDDPDFEKVVSGDFEIDEQGNILTKGDMPQSVENYIVAKQKEKPHWQPVSTGAGANPSGMFAASDISPESFGQMMQASGGGVSTW